MRILLIEDDALVADAIVGALDADVVEGAAVEPLIARLLANADVSYIHAHYAKRGCYSGRIDRA